MSCAEAAKVSMLGWNIKAGGFDSYEPALAAPSREDDVCAVISDFHVRSSASAVSLSDAYRWDVIYGGDEGIARHMGYPYARFMPLDDERLRARGEDGIGVVFATDQQVHSSEPLDLGTRQGLRTTLDIGKYGLQVASVYLDDRSEETRLRQARALAAGLEKDMPTILIGDFNALRPSVGLVSPGVRARDMAVRALAFSLPRRVYLSATIQGMNKREVIPVIESFGYMDADAHYKRPTAPAILPVFGIDYAFHNNKVTIDNFKVLPTRTQSDHRAIAFDATIN